MRSYRMLNPGLDALRLEETPSPAPAHGEAIVDVKAVSLNYRDLMVARGVYNPKQVFPAVPISDGAGVVSSVGPGVTRVRVGDHVMAHVVTGWLDGPFLPEHRKQMLGTPGPGLAAERVALPAEALLPIPRGYSFAQAATLPIAGLTAWSALVTAGRFDPLNPRPGRAVMTHGTGGVSIFVLQIAKALGAQLVITSSSDEKLKRARELGADHTINYRTTPAWERVVRELVGGEGVDVVVETVGGTLEQSLAATRSGGVVALLGVLGGSQATISTSSVLMRRLTIAGIMVDSRTAFEALVRFIEQHRIEPVIDRVFRFEQLPEALRYMESGGHFGKIVVEL